VATLTANDFLGFFGEIDPESVVVVVEVGLGVDETVGDGELELGSVVCRKTLFATFQCVARYEPDGGDVLK
jgi:hypothetical protein